MGISNSKVEKEKLHQENKKRKREIKENYRKKVKEALQKNPELIKLKEKTPNISNKELLKLINKTLDGTISIENRTKKLKKGRKDDKENQK